ncbi:PaaI family thioesterase [Staphylospora marina]|uniref:PaaI family thioesterase n=1 Tax=Staphylospora marina TaxID=2490858 RepID=UPI001F15612F|nr:PaaI family thioesterase [Staphylospora marina]
MDLHNELLRVLEEGNDEEREILRLTLQAIRQKRERQSAWISGYMGLSGSLNEDGSYEFQVPVTPFMMNRAGMVHGGISATLADSTIGSLVHRHLPEGYGAVTVELKINYLQPGRGEMLISRARLLRMGKTLAIATCEIKTDRDTPVCFATGTFYIYKKR